MSSAGSSVPTRKLRPLARASSTASRPRRSRARSPAPGGSPTRCTRGCGPPARTFTSASGIRLRRGRSRNAGGSLVIHLDGQNAENEHGEGGDEQEREERSRGRLRGQPRPHEREDRGHEPEDDPADLRVTVVWAHGRSALQDETILRGPTAAGNGPLGPSSGASARWSLTRAAGAP